MPPPAVMKDLNAKAKDLADLLSEGISLERAWRRARYTSKAEAWDAAGSSAVQTAVFISQKQRIRELASLAVKAMREILDLPGEDLPTLRLKRDTAQIVLPLAGHVAPAAGKGDNASDKSPAEMTNEELQERLRLADQAKAVLADRAHPVLEGEADSAPSGKADKTQAVDMLD